MDKLKVRQGWIMYCIAVSFYFYDFILKLIPSVMMDNIIDRLDISTEQFGFVEFSFYATYIPMQLFCGPILDEYGPRKILPSVIGLCLLGSVISAVTRDYYWYLLARLLIGFGSAFAFVSVLKIASEWLPKRAYPFLSGLTTTFGMLGGIFSESIVPMFNDYDQGYFYSGICLVAVMLIVLSVLFVRDGEQHDEPFDLLLILKDIKTVLSRQQIWVAGLIGLAMFSPIQLFVTWAIPFFAHDLIIDKITSGNIASMVFWGTCVFAPIVGWIASRTQHMKSLLLLGNSLSLIGMIMVIFSAHNSVLSAMLLMFLVGAGISAQPLVFVYATREVDIHLTATAVAATNFIVNLSSLLQPYIGSQLKQVSRSVYSLDSWRNALAIIPLLLFINFLFIYILKETRYDNDNS